MKTAMIIGALLVGYSLLASRKAFSAARSIVQPSDNFMPIINPRRGERLNNPGNIRHGSAWQGMADDQPDSAFVKFVSPEYGIRAMGKILLTYQDKYGLRTIRQIVSRWAPPNENDTEAYIRFASQLMGRRDSDVLDMHNSSHMQSMIRALIQFEQGRLSYSHDVIASGIQRAMVA